MSLINQEAADDWRNVRSGKDGKVLDANGKLLASVKTFHPKENVSTQEYTPVGAMQSRDVPVSFKVTIDFDQWVVEDDQLIDDILEMNETGVAPDWNFQGVIVGYNGSENRMVYPHCVPSGDVDLQNIEVGTLLTRSMSLTVNGKVQREGRLTK